MTESMQSDARADVQALTEDITRYARQLGANLVGVAPVSRWDKAPIEHSPQGIFPAAKNVIVCACHFLDAPAELGAEQDPRYPGPAMTQMNVSAMLHDIAWKVMRRLERLGHQALFVRQSGQWRYRAAPLSDGSHDRGWVGDMCHYYAAVCAGLGEVGWQNICLTPEFGPRQRFVSIVTDAELTPTPMYDGPALCDRCKLCAKNCPTRCFDEDVSGEMRHIEIEGRRYEFPDRNLWRCATGENFMLDVLLDEWRGKHVDEALMTEMEERAVKERNEWITGWKMGMCLKHCMSKPRRYFDRDYCKAPRRRRDVEPDASPETLEAMTGDVRNLAETLGVDMLATVSAEDYAGAGVDLKQIMPDAAGAVVIGLGYPDGCELNVDYHAARAEIMIGYLMQERYGFSVLPRSGLDEEQAAVVAGLARPSEEVAHEAHGGKKATVNYSLRMDTEYGKVVSDRFGRRQRWRVILTSAPLERQVCELAPQFERVEATPSDLTQRVRRVAADAGADLVGIMPAARMDAVVPQLAELFARESEDYFVVEDQGWSIDRPCLWGGQGWPFNPQARPERLQPTRPADHLDGARSVIVLGVALPDASIDQVGQPLAHKAGHYHTVVHEEAWSQLETIQLTLSRLLEAAGHAAAPTRDLCGLAGRIGGAGQDLLASRFAAVAAGLGEIGWNGIVLTPQFGPRQRFVCLVTDAELDTDDVYAGPALCTECKACVQACPMAAIAGDETLSVAVEGRTFRWGRLDLLRCDFSKRYKLIPESGGMYSHARNDVAVPERITPEYIVEAVRNSDRIQRPGYTPAVERCFTACPVGADSGRAAPAPACSGT
ncbi:MAG: 4Fe-4S dicluster domain-containing protein [Phycisphaerae bacterium]|nr:4Fe-4S dicluster domain-containing protein [Phycisphaerae bacterium]